MARAGKSGQKAMGEDAGVGRGGYQQTDTDPGISASEKVKNIRQIQRGTKPAKGAAAGRKSHIVQKTGGLQGAGPGERPKRGRR
jgi:hypothetical protein